MPGIDYLLEQGTRPSRIAAGGMQLPELDHRLGGQIRVTRADGLLVDRQSGVLVLNDVAQDRRQADQRVQVPRIDRLLIGRPRGPGLIPYKRSPRPTSAWTSPPSA